MYIPRSVCKLVIGHSGFSRPEPIMLIKLLIILFFCSKCFNSLFLPHIPANVMIIPQIVIKTVAHYVATVISKHNGIILKCGIMLLLK